ncbi:MAG: hypothetical protein WDO14_12160 [Bacteroidota bacterium]
MANKTQWKGVALLEALNNESNEWKLATTGNEQDWSEPVNSDLKGLLMGSFPKMYFISTEGYVVRRDREIIIFDKNNLTSQNIPIDILEERLLLNSELDLVAASIERSKYILKLEDNWDDEGSPKYDPDVWARATKFVARYAMFVLQNYNTIILAPRIYHSVSGSIDVLWKNDKYQLLVNIPKDKDSLGKFYGDDYDKETIEGVFNPEETKLGLALILAEQSNVAD